MVSLDDASAEQLTQAFDGQSFDYDRCPIGEAEAKFTQARLDLLIINFDDSAAAENLMTALRRSPLSKTALTLTVSHSDQVTHAFGAGANFVLSHPVSADHARATFRAAAALLQRERRRQFRVPVQLPVTLSCDSAPDLEGILLDLSEGGMDVLAAHALSPGQQLDVNFCLPHSDDMLAHAQVVWANSNGQSGLQFVNLAEEQCRSLSSWLGSNAPQLPPEDPEPLVGYKLSDLSLGGCYIETLSPFPKGTKVDVCLRVGDFEIHLDAAVRVVYPGHGIGLEFAAIPDQHELVLRFIERLSTQAGASPDVLLWPKAFNFKSSVREEQKLAEETEDPLVELLCSPAALTQEEFLAALRQQRSSHSQEAAPA
jgi:PilZ domain